MRTLGLVPILLLYARTASCFEQLPLLVGPSQEQTVIQSDEYSQWNFNYSSAAPHFFSSVKSLLKQWPNVFFPNGHSIVPCEIPAFTKLYHGRRDGDFPPSPEWLAFDIGMSYGIMGGFQNSHMLTWQTTRVVKCVYFDGESAALMGTGQLDTQMLHLYGNVSGPPPPADAWRGLWGEYDRALGLCEWLQAKELGGRGWGVEGIVRMNAGFEMIWCNFTSPSLKLVSHLNVSAPLLPVVRGQNGYLGMEATKASHYPLPPESTRPDETSSPIHSSAPPNWRNDWAREPFRANQLWNWVVASSRHYGSNGGGAGLGESRIKILGCGFLSYYANKFDQQAIGRATLERKYLNLTTSGLWQGPGIDGVRRKALAALMRRRRLHTLDQISKHEAATMKRDSEAVLRAIVDGSQQCSGIDWSLVTEEIVADYAEPLAAFSKALQDFQEIVTKNETAVKGLLAGVRETSHTLLLPFLQYPEKYTTEVYKRYSRLFNETLSRCTLHYTRLLDPDNGIILSQEEANLKWAVEETTNGICNVIVDVGLSIESLWQIRFNSPPKPPPLKPGSLQKELSRWIAGVEELMAWLGWAAEWTQCENKCAWHELCYIPMWPLISRDSIILDPGEDRVTRGPPGYDHNYGKPGDAQSPYFHGPSHENRTRYPRPPRYRIKESALWEPQCHSQEDYFA